MAKYSDREIPDMSYDWSNDRDYGGLPFSGRSVQSFIKKTFNDKARTGYFDASKMKLYLFKDDADKAEFEEDQTKESLAVGVINLAFDKTQYRIRVTPIGGTTINASIDQDQVLLAMDLQSETKSLDESVWTPTNDDILVKVYADINNTGLYEEIPALQREVLGSVGHLELNVRSYLPVGTSRFRLLFTDKQNTTITASQVWNITLAEMYIENFDNTWYKALVETGSNEDYHIGGFKIVGSVYKTLHIEISTSSSLAAYYEVDLGTSESLITAFKFDRTRGLNLTAPTSYDGTSLPALTTGIYNVRVWLTSGTVSTEDNAITYSIMYVAPGDTDASLVVMNNAGNEVNNYDESAHLCDYAVYNGGGEYGNPSFTITPSIDATPGVPDTFQLQVQTGTVIQLNYKIELFTNGNISIKYRIDMEDNYQENSSRVNNTETFPAEYGTSFYLNTSVRSNGEDDKESIYNTASSKTKLNGTEWQGMSWVDGVDGWTVDDLGTRKCLALPAGSKLTLSPTSFFFMPGGTTTYELCYKVKNVSDYDEDIITIGSGFNTPGFMGVRIKPTNVTVHSSADNSDANDLYRGTNLADEETVHLLISIQYSYNALGEDYNLVTGYINGCKNFQFSFDKLAGWGNDNASVIFGSSTADLYLYMFRVYNNIAVIDASAEKNWLNSLETRDEKISNKNRLNSVLKQSTRQIDYEKIKNEGKYNFFVVEMTSGSAHAPNKSYPNGGRANIEMHYGADENGNSRSSWDWKIYDVETKGQGTTSMGYWLWNIRCRIDKTVKNVSTRQVSYYDTPIIKPNGDREFVELPAEERETVWFDGENNHPGVKRITAKINYASSMQSHKMGATAAYNVLHDNILNGALLNAAQRTARTNGLPMPSVAVYQYPAFGFEKIVSNGVPYYTFIGLFTIGPDKGDKPTFGYNLVSKDDLVTLEGVDHEPAIARFSVPWDEQVIYTVADKECLSLKNRGYEETGNIQEAFEVTNAGRADTGEPEETLPVLVNKFKSAYEVIYNNSTLIFPIALSDPTWGGENADAQTVLSNINSNIKNFQGTAYGDDGRLSYASMEFWIEGEYHLYHYELESGKYVSGKKESGVYANPLDLRVDTGISDSSLVGLSLAEQNELFKQARRDRFIAEAPNYWDMNELAFNYAYLVIFEATDNFAKNQYPQYMGAEDKWRFRQDDLDTIMDIDNNGGQTKTAYLEYLDSNNGYLYFAGSNSILWNLVNETLWGDYTSGGQSYYGIRTIGRSIIETMYDVAHGDNYYEGFINFFDKYFWSGAQQYFPQSSYNIDANLKYEGAWLNYAEPPVPPLQQSLGDHYAAERLWVKRRALYCMSLFGAGAFGSPDEGYLGVIFFRPVRLTNLTVTVAEPMYPCLFVGTNVQATGRTFGNSDFSFHTPSTEGEARFAIMAADNLVSLGDLRGLQISPQDSYTLSLSGKKLRDITLGGESGVTTNIRNLTISGTGELPCLERVDIRNVADLAGVLDLSQCKRVREVYAEGTKLTAVSLPRGSKIEVLHLPDTTRTLSYQITPFLQELELSTDKSNISLVHLEGCNMLNGISTINDIFKSDNQTLQYIKILWDEEQTVTGSEINMLSNIMQNLDKDGEAHNYYGINDAGIGQQGTTPYLNGELVVGKHYASDITTLANGASPADSESHPGLKRIRASYFGGLLYITYPDSPEYEYIEFVDKEVQRVCAENFGDGSGVTLSEAANVNSIGTTFQYNDEIISFNELRYFSITDLANSAFRGCSELVEIELPATCRSLPAGGGYAFTGCSLLEMIKLNASFSSTGTLNFSDCSSLTRVNIPNTDTWLNCTFGANGNSYPFDVSHDGHLYINNTEVTTVVFPSSMSSVKGKALKYCSNIESVTLPTAPDSVGVSAFEGCTSLVSMSPLLPSSIMTIGDYAFKNCTGLTGTLTLPSELRTIGIESFGGCTGFTGTLSIPNKVTSIAKGAFSGCTGFTGNLVLPSSLTTISNGSGRDSDGSFYNCSGFTGTLEIPSTVTHIGNYAFRGCSGLTNVSYTGTNGGNSISVDAFSCGNGTGTMYAPNCTFNGSTYPANRFKRMIIGAYQNNSTANRHFGGSMEEIRILGNFGLTNQNEGQYILQGSGGNVKFVEILGIFDNVPNAKFGQSNATYHIGAIVHLGYDAVEHNALPANPTNANASYSNIETIYVGTGDATRDQQILDMYLADTDWAAYSSKLAKWSDYNGVYKTMPTPPFV